MLRTALLATTVVALAACGQPVPRNEAAIAQALQNAVEARQIALDATTPAEDDRAWSMLSKPRSIYSTGGSAAVEQHERKRCLDSIAECASMYEQNFGPDSFSMKYGDGKKVSAADRRLTMSAADRKWLVDVYMPRALRNNERTVQRNVEERMQESRDKAERLVDEQAAECTWRANMAHPSLFSSSRYADAYYNGCMAASY